jgi:RHS repeat-associated protein
MITNETQVLSASGGMGGSYTWSLASGGGNLSASTGSSVTFTAPASNPHCSQNPILQVTDACGRSAVLKLAVTSNDLRYSQAYHQVYCQSFSSGTMHLQFDGYSCSGQVSYNPHTCTGCAQSGCGGQIVYIGHWDVCQSPCDPCPCTCEELVEACHHGQGFYDDPGGCNPAGRCDPGIYDLRTEEMKGAGCCPAGLLGCVAIEDFKVDRRVLNLSGGEKARISGNLSTTGGGSLGWKVSIADRTFQGTGSSFSVLWDGKGSSRKEVRPGTHLAQLEVQASGGFCQGKDFRSLPIQVTARERNDHPATACVVDPNVFFGSSANLATGNLGHSQVLFLLPQSKFQADFAILYNSLDARILPLGTGWTHTFHTELGSNNDGSYTLMEGNGKRTVLYRNTDRYTPEGANYPSLTFNGDATALLEKKVGVFYHFDSDGKILRIFDRNSNQILFTYDSSNQLTRIADPSGRSIFFEYDSQHRIRQITDPHGNIHIFSYEAQHLTGITSQILGLGTRSWAFTYDDQGFMLTKTDPLGRVHSYTYDSDYRAAQVIDPEGRGRSLAYDASDSRTQFLEEDGGLWAYRYESSIGFLTEKADPLGNTNRYVYDSAGNLASITDPQGNLTTFTYDANGNMTSVTDALGNSTFYTYNALNKATSITYPGESQVLLAYDSKGNLTSVTDPLGNTTQFAYDIMGNLTHILNPLGQRTIFAYDSRQYLVSLTNPVNGITSFGYDSAGKVLSHTDPLGNLTQLEYNGVNQITRVVDPEGHILAYAYDAVGNLKERTDANGKKTQYEYNYRGQATKILDALNNPTQFAYGSGCPSCGAGGDRLTSLTDGKGQITSWEYNLAGWPIKETSPLGYSKSYTYDGSGNLISRTDEKGHVTQYSYDRLNRVTSIVYSNGDTAAFAYDARGNLIAAGNPNIHYTFAYDLNNRLLSTSDSHGKTIRYQYDGLGNRTQMTSPDGRTLSYQYDPANRLSRVLSQTGSFTFSYDVSGRKIGLGYPHGLQTDYDYSPSGYLTRLTSRSSLRTVINSFSYTHDAMGNRTSVADMSGTYEYTYDGLYQLLKATHPDGSRERFKYDPVGNRLNKVLDAENRLLEDMRFTYEYDASGNQTREVNKRTGEVRTFAYDGENRLVEVREADKSAQYKYDPFGRRIEKEVNGNNIQYLYDGGNIILEYGERGNIKSRYHHGLGVDEPLALERKGQIFYYHADGLGSITDLTDALGAVVKSYRYKSFGKIEDQLGSLHQPFTFTGREWDSEIGLYYYRSRYYNPRTGRFLTKDPIGFLGSGTNLYRYVQNNPINWIDPWGLLMGGEEYGEAAALYWASAAINPNNEWYQTAFYTTMGLFASLWTPNTSEMTATTLLGAMGASKSVGNDPYWRYVGQKSNPNSPWMTRGPCPPYGRDFPAAKDALQLPNMPNDVRKVNVPWYQPVRGPRPVSGNEKWGAGGGPEYYKGWRWP